MPIPPQLSSLASTQAGAVTRAQALEHGLTDPVIGRLLREGRWCHVAVGVYGLGPPTWQQDAWAGLLIGGPGTVLGREAAAYLNRLRGDPPPIIDLFTPRRPARPEHRWRFIRGRRDGFGRPLRTSLAQTIVDLTATASVDDVAAALARAVTDLRFDPATIGPILDRQPRHRHARLLRDMIAEVEAGVMGPLERRYHLDVERAHGLPESLHQARLVDPYRCDVCYQEQAVIVELDGRGYHRDSAHGIDMARDNAHRLHSDALTLRYSWSHVAGRPCDVARQVALALRQRGWTGHVTTCPRCSR